MADTLDNDIEPPRKGRSSFSQLYPLADPFGPGSPCWNAFDRALDHLEAGRERDYKVTRDTCLRQLRSAGAPASMVADWRQQLTSQARDIRAERRADYPGEK